MLSSRLWKRYKLYPAGQTFWVAIVRVAQPPSTPLHHSDDEANNTDVIQSDPDKQQNKKECRFV